MIDGRLRAERRDHSGPRRTHRHGNAHRGAGLSVRRAGGADLMIARAARSSATHGLGRVDFVGMTGTPQPLRLRSRASPDAVSSGIGLLDHIRSAADRVARRITARSARRETTPSGTIRARSDNPRPDGSMRSRRRASVTCGVYLRPSGSSPTRCISRSCSACKSINAGDGATFATTARGLRPPKDDTPSSRNSKAARLTRSSIEATSCATRHVDIADEAQGDVIIFRIDPARARAARRAGRSGSARHRQESRSR